MSYGYRSASFDLFFEQLCDTSSASQHIPESHRDELCAFFLIHEFEQFFSDSFGRPHHARGIDRFIRRDEDKFFDIEFDG